MFNSPLSRGQATGPHFGLGAIFRSLDLIHNSAVAVSDDRAGGHLRSLRRQMPLRLVEQLILLLKPSQMAHEARD
jgi:hypothetical protein